MNLKSLFIYVLLLAVLQGAVLSRAHAEDQGTSGLPLPRFASLKSDNAYVRAGPSMDYPIRWVYKKEGLPVEIIQEFDSWRKIVDADGEGGWVHKILLSSNRRAKIIQPDAQDKNKQQKTTVTLYRNEEMVSPAVALEAGVIVSVEECQKLVCHVTISPYNGWIEKKYLWGVYGSDIFN